MTTAHRPTWKPAVGKSSEGGWSAGGARSAGVSHLDLAAHTKLKLRRGPQVVDKNKALRESLFKLEEAEKKTSVGKRAMDPKTEEEGRRKLLTQTAEVDDAELRKKYDDGDAAGGSSSEEDDLDDSDSDLDRGSDDDDSDGDSDEDDSDDEAALQAELAKIRAERESTKQRKESEEAAVEESKMEEAALLGNPLLNAGGGNGGAISGRLKRKWNDDVVFRNQAKNEPKIQKRFINDTVRNDFHKRFMNKFIR